MSSMGSPARYLSMARCRCCSCAFAMGDSFGAYYHTGLARLLFVLDVMARSSRLRLHVAALGRRQGCRVPRFRPFALVGAQLSQPLSFVGVCPDGQRPPDTSTLRLCTQPKRCHLYKVAHGMVNHRAKS